MRNAYNELLEIMGGATVIEPSFFMAKVTSPLPNIKISLQGITLDKEDFLISKTLLLNSNANISCSTGNIQHNLKDTLNTGDKVLLVKLDDTYILIDKVVSL